MSSLPCTSALYGRLAIFDIQQYAPLAVTMEGPALLPTDVLVSQAGLEETVEQVSVVILRL